VAARARDDQHRLKAKIKVAARVFFMSFSSAL
jgi:hypothetical protein